MIRSTVVAALVALVLLVGAASAGYVAGARHVTSSVDDARLAHLDAALARLDRMKPRADTVYLTAVEHFHTTHDSVVTAIAAAPGDSVSKPAAVAAVEQVTRSCSAVVSACEARATIADAIADTLRAENTLLRSRTVPRFGLTASALYDPVARTETGRVGTSLRLIGPLSAVAEAEATRWPGDTVRGAVRVGGRWRFR